MMKSIKQYSNLRHKYLRYLQARGRLDPDEQQELQDYEKTEVRQADACLNHRATATI